MKQLPLSTYYPDSGELISSSGVTYSFKVDTEEEVDNFLVGVALVDLLEGRKTIQECYDNIKVNYDITPKQFERYYTDVT